MRIVGYARVSTVRQAIEAEQWRGEAEALRAIGLKAPIAGSSHWRREPEFATTQAAPGLDLIDDRVVDLEPHTKRDVARLTLE